MVIGNFANIPLSDFAHIFVGSETSDSGMLSFVLLGTVLPREQQLNEALELSLPAKEHEVVRESVDAPSSHKIQHNRSSLSYSDQCNGLFVSMAPRRSARVTLTTAVYVVTILILVSICRAVHNREQVPGLMRRRLSEGGEGMDEDQLSIVEECLQLEADLGLLYQRATSSPDKSDSSSRIAELVSMLSDAAQAHESMQGRSVAFGGISTGEVVPDERQSNINNNLLKWQHASSSGSDVLRYMQSGYSSLPVEPRFSSVSPALDVASWIQTVPCTSIQAERQEADRAFSVDCGASNAGKASTTSVLTPPSAEVMTHPYVRLPVLEAGVVPRDIDTSRLFSSHGLEKPRFCHALERPLFSHALDKPLAAELHKMRKLFVKKTLNQEDADNLIASVETLTSIMWARAQRRHRDFRPFAIAGLYAINFLAFDSLVCAMQLLGDSLKVHLWWNNFVDAFDFRLHLKMLQDSGAGPGGFCRRLAKRLAPVLLVYKAGNRADLAEVLALKRLVFCSQDRPKYFKSPEWTPWQRDGGC
ncbi:hypothetical protein, conserved [Eimeria maxima]|uniref:Uncharacterized protein n=1 Tax=Eimeria maxima TaxID=5804 RepID=U6MJ86_EIMMA|nr:hypothetical protein, conserved [Eimeria maxima]CDJ61715.1 hypothetical protein, conserved [Eimeria maxima]